MTHDPQKEDQTESDQTPGGANYPQQLTLNKRRRTLLGQTPFSIGLRLPEFLVKISSFNPLSPESETEADLVAPLLSSREQEEDPRLGLHHDLFLQQQTGGGGVLLVGQSLLSSGGELARWSGGGTVDTDYHASSGRHWMAQEPTALASSTAGTNGTSTIAVAASSDPQQQGFSITGSGGAAISMMNTAAGSDPRFLSHPILRRCAQALIQGRFWSDVLPDPLYVVATQGRMVALILIAANLFLGLAFWFPLWCLSFVLTELGVYLAALALIVLLGRSLLRFIAFPGASPKVTQEMEWEFARYSVRMLSSAAQCWVELGQALEAHWQQQYAVLVSSASGSNLAAHNHQSQTPGLASAPAWAATTHSASIEIMAQWSRAWTFRSRVVGLYYDVLLVLYQQEPTSDPQQPYRTKYGNHRLTSWSGDLGDLSRLTPQARLDGRELLTHLQNVLRLMDELEPLAEPWLHVSGRKAATPPTGEVSALVAALTCVQSLTRACRDMHDFVLSLKPVTSRSNARDAQEADGHGVNSPGPSQYQDDETGDDVDRDDDEDDDEEHQPGSDDPAVAMRRKVEERNASTMDAFKAGLQSILPMLDPPPHANIFGFDVQRCCMLSRYKGARQFWIRRLDGGLIDVLHFPAPGYNEDPQGPRNPRAMLYCNPNAGLIEVAAGMSLTGGNISETTDGKDHSWVDFYTHLGLDVYVFNYSGYGRSYGTTLCVRRRFVGDVYSPGLWPRLLRIFTSCFLTFQPSPNTLRADGITVGQYLLIHQGVQQLVIHGESIGGVAASATARELSRSPATRSKVALLICDRTFSNLEAVAQRLVGGWSGFTIRVIAPLWNSDVAGHFLEASCPKVVANDAADEIIHDASSLKSGLALWKELHRSPAGTSRIGWMMETPLRYRMADFDNVCVNDSRHSTAGSFVRNQAPSWPADKYITLEEAFHFAACCKRIGKVAKQECRSMTVRTDNEQARIMFTDHDEEVDPNRPFSASLGGPTTGYSSTRPLVMQAWIVLACCDGLTGSTLGVAVKRGLDVTVSWLCTSLVFGGQVVRSRAEHRARAEQKQFQPDGQVSLAVQPGDFDSRPAGYEHQENEAVVFPKPIPTVIEQLVAFLDQADPVMRQLSHEWTFVIGMLQYVQARLSAPAPASSSVPAVKANDKFRPQMPQPEGCFLKLTCGHNNPFSKDEKKQLKLLLQWATAAATIEPSNSSATPIVTTV